MKPMSLLMSLAIATAIIAHETVFAQGLPLTVEPQLIDYPPDAITSRVEGNVSVNLRIDPSGNLSCEDKSSKAADGLRLASCKLIVSRWPFSPLTEKGRPATNGQSVNVKWRLKQNPGGDDFGGAAPISREAWFSNDNYPIEGIRKHIGGTVSLLLDISSGGRVNSCQIMSSSNRIFDDVSCGVLKARAMFLPPLDAAGKPRSTQGRMIVNWRLPR